jgi:hypothetical protein
VICWEATREIVIVRQFRRVCQTHTRPARPVLATGGEHTIRHVYHPWRERVSIFAKTKVKRAKVVWSGPSLDLIAKAV